MKEKGEKYVLDNICYANIKSDRSEGYPSFLALAFQNNWGRGWAERTEKTLEGEKLKTFARNLSLRCANMPHDLLQKTLESSIWHEITGSAEAAEKMKDSIRLGQISVEQAKIWWENRERVEGILG